MGSWISGSTTLVYGQVAPRTFWGRVRYPFDSGAALPERLENHYYL
jgi:hypothetical protein